MTPDVDGLIVDVEEGSEYGFDGWIVDSITCENELVESENLQSLVDTTNILCIGCGMSVLMLLFTGSCRSERSFRHTDI